MSPALHVSHVNLLNNQSRLPTAAHVLVMAAVVVTKWDTNRRTRKMLTQLDPDQLNDIGVSSDAARQEADKPFWRD